MVGVVSVVGLVRMPAKPGRFTPPNDAGRNTWYWRDLDAMLKCHMAAVGSPDCASLAGAPGLEAMPRAYPFSIDAEAEPANPGGWPKGGTTNLNLPNRHLEYAVTWYGLALTLIGVYAVFAWGRLRSGAGDSRHFPTRDGQAQSGARK